ncbi:hypothetical protein [Streptomyces fradiae]|uniref:hypothetical protein n=1 Tax=Streptomyces fradiae TaxID=1906 RepID=UPI003513D515
MSENTRARANRKKALAVATTFGIAAGLCATTTAPATAAPAAPAATTATDEVVVPNPGRFLPRGEDLGQAGATGYAHKQEGSAGWAWTDFATGADKPITQAQATDGHSGLHAVEEVDPNAPGDRVKVTDLATGDTRVDVVLPNNNEWTGAYNADTVVSAGRDENHGIVSVQLLRIEDGKQTATPVTGLSEVFEGSLDLVAQDAKGALLRFYREGDQFPETYLLDYATAALKPAPVGDEAVEPYLGATHIVEHNLYDDTVASVPRTDSAAKWVTTPMPDPGDSLGLGPFGTVGDWIVITRPVPGYKQPYVTGEKLQAVHIGTGEVKDLLPHAAAELATAPDGSLLAVGGTSATDWALQRVTVGADGTPQITKVRDIPPVAAKVTDLALGGGRLSFRANAQAGPGSGIYDSDTSLTGTPTATAPKLRANLGQTFGGLASLGDGESVYSTGSQLRSPITTSTFRTADVPSSQTGHKITDTSGRYVLATGSEGTVVADLENYTDTSDVVLPLPDSSAALWGSKVWKPTATAGQVNAYDLKTKTTSAAVDLDSATNCRPTELQAVGNWLYWACGADKAGVYDITLKKSVAVPTGEALLGDGFVVRHEGDKLRRTDAATGETTDFADLPASAAGSGRRETWTVDRFGGDVAFVDAKNEIHVKRIDGPRAPLAQLVHSVEDLGFEGSGVEPSPATWSPVFRFSKPVGSWELRIAKGNGEGVRTLTGSRGDGAAVRVQWDGKDSKGRGIESGQYRWELIARPLDGTAPQGLSGAFNVTGSSLTTLPGTFTPVTPARLLDTRSGLGATKAKVGPNGTVLFKVAGQAGVPAEGLTSVVLNVTATNATADSFVSVYPYETQRTAASSLNFKAGQTVANLVTVPVVNGWVELYNKNGSVDLLADVAGFYQEGTAGSAYEPVAPKRLMDTRTGIGVPKAKVGAGQTVTLTVAEPGVTAVALNLTATNGTSASFVSAYPYGTTRPEVSSVNFAAGQTVPNMVVVPVKDGKITFYNRSGSVDLIGDVAGYFKQGSGAVFTGMQPKRLMDTRNGTGVPKAKIGAGQTVSLTVGTKYKAVVLNVTATNPTATSFVSVYPYGTARPAASNLNFVAGQTVPNGVVVPVKDGKITFYNHSGTVDLIADVTGFYTD